MRLLFIIFLLMLPLCNFAENESLKGASNITYHYSNENKEQLLIPEERSSDFPTQIVRMYADIRQLQLECDEVNKQIESIFVNKIPPDSFTYNTYIYCGYDPQTELATNFSINSYFDPLSDRAIEYLKNYLAEYNGRELLGTTFKVEPAKGVITSLTLQAGYKYHPNKLHYVLLQQDHSNFYFKNNYELRKELIADIYQRFYSNDAKVILPFLDRWIYPKAGNIYQSVLQESNYVELQPERIFLMQDEGDIFVSDLRYYFAHPCHRNPNKRCL